MVKEFICSLTEPVVETKAGKLRGYKYGDMYYFLGVTYAHAKRWQMPEPVEPWEGVKDATGYGYGAPLLDEEKPDMDVFFPHRYWSKSEDCQCLNVWTQSLDRNAKKPVMVWIHGGGYFSGSSIEHVSYDGENMCRFGDAVVVSMNHRLNCLGYFDVSAFGEKYKNSGNAGNADLVVCLEWIRDNIAAFGGDPDNVTVFGQSGGGRKILALLQTPAADGLFHKAIVQSGTMHDSLKEEEPGSAKELAEAVMKELGIDDFETLANETPWQDLFRAMNKVLPDFADRGFRGMTWMPHKNDWYLGDIRDGNPVNEASNKVSVIIGTCFGESGGFSFPKVDKYHLSDDECNAIVREKYGEKSEELIPLFKEAYPEKSPLDLVAVDDSRRFGSLDFLRIRSPYRDAPVYSYLFAFDFPLDGGTPAWHCADIPFAFHNIDKVPVCNVPGVSENLQDEVFGAFMNFARTGDPSTETLAWKPFTNEEKNTMIFCEKSGVREGHDIALLETMTGEKIV